MIMYIYKHGETTKLWYYAYDDSYKLNVAWLESLMYKQIIKCYT